MKTRQILGIALSILLLAAALPASANLECPCENGDVVETTSDDPADCDDACADLAGSRSVHRPQPGRGGVPNQHPTPPPDDDDPNSRMP